MSEHLEAGYFQSVHETPREKSVLEAASTENHTIQSACIADLLTGGPRKSRYTVMESSCDVRYGSSGAILTPQSPQQRRRVDDPPIAAPDDVVGIDVLDPRIRDRLQLHCGLAFIRRLSAHTEHGRRRVEESTAR